MTLTQGQILGSLGIVLEGIGLYFLLTLTPWSFKKYYHASVEGSGKTIAGKYNKEKREFLKTQIPIALGLLFQFLAVFIP